MDSLIIEAMQAYDWEDVRRIYVEGIQTGQATFERQPPTWEDWDNAHAIQCRFVGRCDGIVVGWAALSPVSHRSVYAGVAEVSIYVSQDVRRRGNGHRLLKALIDASEIEGFWTLQAGIFPENTASIELHTRLGFREVGRRERIGKMNERWRDVVLLERRSAVAGIN